jgi:alginate O-acetyltransferase complex protein AlgJ
MRSRLIIGAFIAALVVPLAAFVAGAGTAERNYEAAALHPKPEWKGVRHGFAYAGAWLDYFDDHFGLRQPLIRVHALASMRLFHTSPSPTVIAGRDGWLYYADDGALEDYVSASLMNDEDLDAWRAMLVDTRDSLRRRGIGFVVLIAPDKHVVYPEHLPPSLHHVGESRIDQLLTCLRTTTDLSVVDVRQPLATQKMREQIYYKTDSHWNDRGAYVGYDALLRAVGKQLPGVEPLPRSAFLDVEAIEPGHDLADMLGLADVLQERAFNLQPRVARRARILEPENLNLEGLEVARVVTEVPDPRLPRIVVFRDSFMTQLIPFVSEHFSRAVYLWQKEVDEDVIAQENPAVVIYEMVGRRLHTYVP